MLRSFILLSIILLLASFVGWSGSQHGVLYQDWSVFIICGVIAFAIQWVAFIPAWFLQTERFYDLTGSITYLSVMVIALLLSNKTDVVSLLLVVLIVLWALRLGSFLFKRILQDGNDKRFDEIKPNFLRFLTAWTLQGLWVYITAGAALAAISSSANSANSFSFYTAIGLVLWSVGFAIEIVADSQKRRFRKLQTGSFINTGLWAYSRHPNYFGELVLWIGIAVIAFPLLQGWQLGTLISPLFVYLLLTKLSGIPTLEASSDQRWGDVEEYKTYVANTPILFPKFK